MFRHQNPHQPGIGAGLSRVSIRQFQSLQQADVISRDHRTPQRILQCVCQNQKTSMNCVLRGGVEALGAMGNGIDGYHHHYLLWRCFSCFSLIRGGADAEYSCLVNELHPRRWGLFAIPSYKQTDCERLIPRSDMCLRFWEDRRRRIYAGQIH